jgi:acyl-CoA synthetase (AMP-forming)/AMP-acid ligase II
MRPSTIIDLLASHPQDAHAFEAPGRRPLTYGALRANIVRAGAFLTSRGIGSKDRVAIVLPNGPEMATAFLSVAAHAAAAPLNPAYRPDELTFYLIVQSGADQSATAVAQKLGLAIIELSPSVEEAGAFRLAGAEPLSYGTGLHTGAVSGPEDTALVLHTSGTTSRPKLVPLSQTNLCASACNVRNTLALTAADRSLNILPLFHIHGLVASLLASLAAGGTVICTTGFNALKFFAWMKEFRPSWYTAVPTMHQAILARAPAAYETIESTPLRFVRSSSSSIPPQVGNALESTFQAPLIEAYGMTEAAHQITSNPLPPAARLAGSVGRAAGPEIAVMDENRRVGLIGVAGEIVIRGANVMRGYEQNPQANAEAFVDRWFRTGDQGVISADGYLKITGRLKEFINRGGEKISPREVDEVCLDHPAIEQVVTFAIPHAMLGEEVGVAVVLRDGHTLTDQELRRFVSDHLADFKVPRRIVFLDEIPKGATGKIQRIGLAMKLGLA